jgi:branched-subunit amino acid aminotransferase/4-amino-4-deoxychorismate lyase
MPVIYLNGHFLEQTEAALDPLDRGVLLGDGLFETVRCEDGQLLYHLAHFARMGRGARVLEIPWVMKPEELLDLCQQVLDANNLSTARLRVTLTRGELHGSPEIQPSATAPTLIIAAAPFDSELVDEARERGWHASLVPFPINHRSPLASIKSTSYLDRLLARREARRAGAEEGIVLNSDGLLAEGALSNVFIVRGNSVFTPPVQDGALPGIMRLKVGLLCPRLGIDYREESLTVEDLVRSQEAFFTNSLIEIMPLVTLGDKTIGSGQPGEITKRLQAAVREDVKEFLTKMRSG